MASAYALPTAAIPQHHHHSSEHAHSHNHSHSHSHSHSHTLSQSPPTRGHFGSSRSFLNEHRDMDRSHSRGRASDPSQLPYKASSTHPTQGRTNLVPSLAPSGYDDVKADNILNPRTLSVPANEAFEVERKYDAPSHSGPHHHDHSHGEPRPSSKFTKFLLPYTSKWPLLHAVMTERDSRRIFYFMSLNFSFMAIQAFYGYATDSLGLLSDSIHMFFDCVALAVGLFAALASKWPSSQKFPYGFGKIETLSGFANGVFLILISVEIMFEAFERIIDGRETKRLGELFVVSTIGLLVNLVGMAAFGHHHHGHDHGHGHSHSHGSDQSHGAQGCDGHSHSHSHDHGHDHSHGGHSHDHGDHGEKHAHSHAGHSHSHGHSHDNENLYGIYLHVLADTLGSAAVIVSTVLTHFWPWAGWDPVASFLIAVLILLSSLPLVKSSAKRLLLTVPDDIEYTLRDTLSGIVGLRGVVGYAAPKFWVDDRNFGDDAASGNRLLGVMHVVAARGADMDDVRDRVRNYLLEHNLDIVLQVEREGDMSCWCGVGRSPLSGHKSTKSTSIF